MIEFNNINQETPYLIFKKKYDQAYEERQKNIEAIAISSYNKLENEVDSRFVNLKFIDENKFIFFSNYNSPKSIAFSSNSQISALLFWPSINVQIRMKAEINKTSTNYNNEYFKKRSMDKNALAISSNQSQSTDSFDDVIAKYKEIKESKNLLQCPNYWGGFSFIPYYFEFWEGHSSRLNKRDAYEKTSDSWRHSILQP